LLLVEPRGLGGRELTVSRYAPSGGGRFAVPPRRVKVSDDAGSWSYEGDVDGDGLADLLQLVGGSLAMHRGQGGARAAAVAAHPEWSLALAGGAETRAVEVGLGSGGTSTTVSDGGTEEGGARGAESAARRGQGERRDRHRGDERRANGDEGDEEESYGPSRLAVADLDRDGRSEILHWRTRESGGSELTVIWQPKR
jgi:hypothetical protein